jgi:hypothetical protein
MALHITVADPDKVNVLYILKGVLGTNSWYPHEHPFVSDDTKATLLSTLAPAQQHWQLVVDMVTDPILATG